LAVASTVARGEGDFGVGNEIASLSVKGIEFIPLQEERYELIIKKEDFEKLQFQVIMQIINSSDFQSELSGIGGYNISEIGNIIY
jgi:putative molybdopterin biosynthesis protein